MRFRICHLALCACVSLGACGVVRAADEAAAEESAVDAALEFEIAYIEALVDNGYPDIAAPVIAETKKKWPESAARIFAMEIRGLLSLGAFEEAEKKIAALPDRKGTTYWAARLEVANNYFARGKKADCIQIYEGFFTAYPKAPKDIRKFYIDASYAYGQILSGDGNFARAAEVYEGLLKEVKDADWCNLAAETIKMYQQLAESTGAGKKRDGYLDAAEKLVDQLLWHNEEPVYFGQAVSMKAHVAVMRGQLDRARELVDEYMPQLQDLHDQILEVDPDGSKGLLRLSPLPECLYLQAKMLWDAAKAEFKKPSRNDEKVKSCLFGAKEGGKRNGFGAFNLATGVFLNYETSPWAAPAGELAEQVRAFAEKEYDAKIKTKITPEQIAKVRAAQFKGANELFLSDDYEGAVKAYREVLAKYPEIPESVPAVANMASAMLDLLTEEKDAERKTELRDDLDAVESYLAERFAGNRDRAMMIAAGNSAAYLAAKELERGDAARADRLYRQFIYNYRRHPQAAPLAAGRASAAQKDGKWSDAVAYWGMIESYYTNSVYFASSLAQLSFCHGKLGDGAKEIAYINRYIPLETSRVKKLQARMQLAQMYQKDGLAILAGVSTNETDEASVAAAEKAGSAQILRAIKNFGAFVTETEEALKDPATPKEDAAKFAQLREAALFLVGDCWRRLTRPAAKLETFRTRAAESYEAYVKAYPEGQYVKTAYVCLGTIYTVMGDVEKSKAALGELTKRFPDSDEAKNAKPRLAKNLIEMGLRREGADIYAEMLRTDGTYTAKQFLDAGEALIETKSWDLANRAFEKAIRLAATNQTTTIARARLGQAKTSYRQGSLAEAAEQLQLFLDDPKMSKMLIAADANFLMVEVASEQGRTEKDPTQRAKYFGAAVAALGKVRAYWKNRPQHEQDSLALLSGDVMSRKIEAEEAMGLKEEAAETCGKTAAMFLAFIQAHGPADLAAFERLGDGEKANLERAYASLLPLLSRQGAAQADQVIRYGEEYRAYFPEGKNRTAVDNCINRAKADLPSGTPTPAPAAESATEESTPSDGEEGEE